MLIRYPFIIIIGLTLTLGQITGESARANVLKQECNTSMMSPEGKVLEVSCNSAECLNSKEQIAQSLAYALCKDAYKDRLLRSSVFRLQDPEASDSKYATCRTIISWPYRVYCYLKP